MATTGNDFAFRAVSRSPPACRSSLLPVPNTLAGRLAMIAVAAPAFLIGAVILRAARLAASV